MTAPRILIYLLRRDLRFADNPVLHDISRSCELSHQPYTHLLPLYIFAAPQVEISGFLISESERSPYPEARSTTSGFWRCGPHRAKFLAESVWDLRRSLETAGSGLEIRTGLVGQIVKELIETYAENAKHGEVVGVWMTSEEGVEEQREERDVRKAAGAAGKDFKLWTDEKYYVDDRDVPCKTPRDLPDVFTSYRKQVEPLRDAPRRTLPVPKKLPPLPGFIPGQTAPFKTPSSLEETITWLIEPLEKDLGLPNPPKWPADATSAHPFVGGEHAGHERIKHLVETGNMTTYKDTRNGMLGLDFSTKLSAWLAIGCVTARQIHQYLLDFEDGHTDLGKGVQGYGKGENRGTAAVRFELLWRDYMRLCTRKFGHRLFRVEGFRNDKSTAWKYPDKDEDAQKKIMRFLEGTTGTGLIDASQRELFLTGYTSNRARQNVASFLAKHLGIDWRIGAEWYECLLIDYDLSSNWGNWQYTAGVGNDPRGEARVFNPVKQAFDYDPEGAYVKNWVEELRGLDDPQYVFQAWRTPVEARKDVKLEGVQWVEDPLKKIEFRISNHGGRGRKAPGKGGKAGGSRGGGGGGGGTSGTRGGNGGGYNRRGKAERTRGQGRMGTMDKAVWNGAVSAQ
ncbi:hypothetical protein MMC17_008405 [Xylographa soralifera]|nr:hypothetical protein [Xylographa soralifera]